MNESELQRIYNYATYPRDSKKYADKGFVNIDDSSRGGTHWTCFLIKDKKSYYFVSFGGTPDNFLLKQLPKPIKYPKSIIQDINSNLCGSYCLYYFYQIERMKFCDTVFKMYFG